MTEPATNSFHRRAAILSVGDELVLGEIQDTNAPWLAQQLALAGWTITERRTAGDDRAALAEHIASLARSVDVLIMTGGLGPTADDLTRFALGDVTDPSSDLVRDEAAILHLRQWFEDRGRMMPSANAVQSFRPRSAQMIANPHGTAPGIFVQFRNTAIFCLPGPPHEMEPMYCNYVLPRVASDATTHVVQVHSFGIGESAAAMRLGSLMDRQRTPIVGTTASRSIVTARIRAVGAEAARSSVDRDAQEVESRWRPWAYGRNDDSLAAVVGRLLTQRQETLAVAESCTGGLLGSMLVDISGSSTFFTGGWITYSNRMKSACLSIDPAMINSHGAVSAQVAAAMATGALHESKASHALAITGIAGPDGGSATKPVGTVFIAHAGASGAEAQSVHVRRFHFTGDRATVRDRSAKAALQMLRFSLLDEANTPLCWEVSVDGSPLDLAQQQLFDRPHASVAGACS